MSRILGKDKRDVKPEKGLIKLKPHNIKPYRNLQEKMASSDRCVLVSATGTGKTYLAGKYAEDSGWTEPGDVLVLVPKNAAKLAWKKVLPQSDIMTYQRLLLKQPALEGYKLVICDETHHLGAVEWGKVFRALTDGYSGKILGLTATPVRYLDNGRNIAEEYFHGNLVTGVQLPQAIDKGILPSFDYITALYDVPKWKRKPNPYTEKLYSSFDLMANEYSCRNILKKHLTDGKYHKIVVFTDSIYSIHDAIGLCSAIFPDAKHLTAHSKLGKKMNLSVYQMFEEDEGNVFLYVVDILNEGIHLKGIDTEIMFRKTRSPAVYLQQLGRALDAGNKTSRVRIFDFVANHMNLRQYNYMQDGSIRWLSDQIRSADRQVIQYDYALEQLELADKIRLLESGSWTETEDSLLRQYYDNGNGIEKLLEFLPGRSRQAIVRRAGRIGICAQRKYLVSEALRNDIQKHYSLKNGWDILTEKYPDLTKAQITNIANRLGLTIREARDKWTEEEDSILRENQGMPIQNLMELIPRRSKASITGRKHSLGIRSIRKRHKWTEEELTTLREHRELSCKEIISQYLPGLTVSMVDRKRKEMGYSSQQAWPEEKVTIFKAAFESGGRNAVKRLPEFARMSDSAISGAAYRCNCKYSGRPTTWTEEEKELCRQWLRIPLGERPTIRSLTDKIPAHSYNGIRDMVKRLERQEN
ncbi:MAG TPA: hypothetical protein IAA06_06095 [Candidatus Blautia faecavium]|uniref:Helicase C-terminal domain-containing protein n=1 Tax=Candidatus Blautia faecavium TaxID=2838487 RepID=A0A9D2RVK6_9FIRM|nr:hypothetical protein [Candidatus Blautia faecavium]